MPGHEPFPANRYVIAQGDSRRVVLYWYWAHNRGVASEYWAKYYLVADSIKMNRSDGSLVRDHYASIPGRNRRCARSSAFFRLSTMSFPLLQTYIPR